MLIRRGTEFLDARERPVNSDVEAARKRRAAYEAGAERRAKRRIAAMQASMAMLGRDGAADE